MQTFLEAPLEVNRDYVISFDVQSALDSRELFFDDNTPEQFELQIEPSVIDISTEACTIDVHDPFAQWLDKKEMKPKVILLRGFTERQKLFQRLKNSTGDLKVAPVAKWLHTTNDRTVKLDLIFSGNRVKLFNHNLSILFHKDFLPFSKHQC